MTLEDAPHGGMLAQDDYVDAPSSTTLRGMTIEYDYTRGTRYRLSFDHDSTLEFTVVDHEGPEATRPTTPPPLRYLARDLRPGMVLVHWLVKPAAIHVTLILDFEHKTVHVAAMMPPNRWEFFDTGQIVSIAGVPPDGDGS